MVRFSLLLCCRTTQPRGPPMLTGGPGPAGRLPTPLLPLWELLSQIRVGGRDVGLRPPARAQSSSSSVAQPLGPWGCLAHGACSEVLTHTGNPCFRLSWMCLVYSCNRETIHWRVAAPSAHTARPAPLRLLGPEATAECGFVGSPWGSAVRRWKRSSTEEALP